MKFYLISETELEKIKKIAKVNIIDKDTKINDDSINIEEVFYSELSKDVETYINDKIKEYCQDNKKLQELLEKKKEYIEECYWSNMNIANDRDILFDIFKECENM